MHRPERGTTPVLALARESGQPAEPQEQAPIYRALIDYQKRGIVPLHTPGHKGVWGPGGQEDLLTELGLACDLPSMEATDNGFHPRTCIAEAQRMAAEVWGAAETFFLVNGSTLGVQAMVLAALSPGEKVLLSRYVHLSVLSALVLSGAVPIYLEPRWLATAGPVPPTAEEVAEHLRQHPDIHAVLLTHPTYYGVGRSLEGVAELCHRHGIALLVDEAHGAHLRFLPGEAPRSAVLSGADIVVQSMHKTIGSLVGTAQIHRGHGGLVPAERIQARLNLLQSTSSNYLLLASIDLARRRMWRSGHELFGASCRRAQELRRRLAAIDGIAPLEVADYTELAGCTGDPLRLVVEVSGLGRSGFDVERFLYGKHRILDEFCDAASVTFVLGPADTPESYERLEGAFLELSKRPRGEAPASSDVLRSMPLPPVALTPREAAFRTTTRKPLAAASGSICGEVISLYPPGIPLICLGERFTAEVVTYCEKLAAEQVCVFADDSSLHEVVVIEE